MSSKCIPKHNGYDIEMCLWHLQKRFTIPQLLGNKRQQPRCREADKERSKKVYLERSVAKTPLTLDRQTGKLTEEHAVAKALLNLSVEPAMSS